MSKFAVWSQLFAEKRQLQIACIGLFSADFVFFLILIVVLVIFFVVSVQIAKIDVPVGIQPVFIEAELVDFIFLVFVLKVLGVVDRLDDEVLDLARGVLHNRGIGVSKEKADEVGRCRELLKILDVVNQALRIIAVKRDALFVREILGLDTNGAANGRALVKGLFSCGRHGRTDVVRSILSYEFSGIRRKFFNHVLGLRGQIE